MAKSAIFFCGFVSTVTCLFSVLSMSFDVSILMLISITSQFEEHALTREREAPRDWFKRVRAYWRAYFTFNKSHNSACKLKS